MVQFYWQMKSCLWFILNMTGGKILLDMRDTQNPLVTKRWIGFAQRTTAIIAHWVYLSVSLIRIAPCERFSLHCAESATWPSHTGVLHMLADGCLHQLAWLLVAGLSSFISPLAMHHDQKMVREYTDGNLECESINWMWVQKKNKEGKQGVESEDSMSVLYSECWNTIAILIQS